MLNIGQNRECFFDDWLLDPDNTTAEHRVHEPRPGAVVMTCGEPWEGDGCCYLGFFFDETWHGIGHANPAGTYRLYYKSMAMRSSKVRPLPLHRTVICYAESADGLHWTKPKLGISEFHGSTENNIILGKETGVQFDNFFVFRDDRPGCPPDERYKGAANYPSSVSGKSTDCLMSFFSADGIHFRFGTVITEKGRFDTLNTVFWDRAAQRYRCYIRDLHANETEPNVRDIRYLESPDFVNWTDPVPLEYPGGTEDCQLYTNGISPYYRAPQLLVGFPTRYVERKEWNGSFDALCGAELRKERMEIHPRLGLAVTDCLFMCSHDGRRFTRYDEAFLRPGPENGRNWVYGDCYPAVGFLEVPSPFEGADPELAMLVPRNHWMNIPKEFQLYTLRRDGFVSLHAGCKSKEKVTTKPFVYDGSALYVNFSTSARGEIVFRLRSGDEVCESCALFGDSTDRRVPFPAGAVAALSGKPVILTAEMTDADLYAVRFGNDG